MHNSSIAVGVLMVCLAIIVLLGRSRILGPLAVIGFVLGALSAGSLFILIQPA